MKLSDQLDQLRGQMLDAHNEAMWLAEQLRAKQRQQDSELLTVLTDIATRQHAAAFEIVEVLRTIASRVGFVPAVPLALGDSVVGNLPPSALGSLASGGRLDKGESPGASKRRETTLDDLLAQSRRQTAALAVDGALLNAPPTVSPAAPPTAPSNAATSTWPVH